MHRKQKPNQTASRMELMEIAAGHEAGHAVMRWSRIGTATDTSINDGQLAGSGFSNGTNQRISGEDAILISLAGIAVETGYGLSEPDFKKAKFHDLEDARELFTQMPFLCHGLNIDAAMQQYYVRACEELRPYSEVIEDISWLLLTKKKVSAPKLRSMMTEFKKSQMSGTTAGRGSS
jgi:hypothetical protein